MFALPTTFLSVQLVAKAGITVQKLAWGSGVYQRRYCSKSLAKLLLKWEHGWMEHQQSATLQGFLRSLLDMTPLCSSIGNPETIKQALVALHIRYIGVVL